MSFLLKLFSINEYQRLMMIL